MTRLVPSSYNHFVPAAVPSTILAFNSASGALVPITGPDVDILAWCVTGRGDVVAEARSNDTLDRLSRSGFFVRPELDERREVLSRFSSSAGETEGRHGLGRTIVLSTGCNFRCTYCFQEHAPRSLEKEDVLGIEAEVESELPRGTYLSVAWFGGEPLLQFETLKRLHGSFIRIAQQKDADYESRLFTNGYLLTRDRVDWFGTAGHLRSIQITIDGPPEVHDRRRKLRNGRGTFSRILQNIVYACDSHAVVVRVNLDRRNVDGFPRLVDLLGEAGLAGKVSVALGHVEPYTETCAGVARHALTMREFASIETSALLLLGQKGFAPVRPIPAPLVGGFCGAVRPTSWVCAPDGLRFRCWSEATMGRGSASGVYSARGTGPGAASGVTTEMRARHRLWADLRVPKQQACLECSLLPVCGGGCPWKAMGSGGPDCPSWKYNLGDHLRLLHLHRSAEIFAKQEKDEGPCA